METLKTIIVIDKYGLILEQPQDLYLVNHIAKSSILTDYIHINDRILYLSFLDNLRDQACADPITLRIQAVDKARFILVDVHCSTIEKDRFYLTFIGTDEDENILQKHDVLNLAKTAHELRSPLNAILGFADLIMHEEHLNLNSQKHYEYVRMIKYAGEHMLNIVDATLQGAKIEHLKAADEVVCFNQILSQITALTQPLQGQRSLILNMQNQVVLTGVTALAINQICLNLISNAIKYTHDTGNIEISISCLDDEFAELLVKDDGIGMDQITISQLGRPYIRAFNAIGTQITGSGLGLSIVHDLVKFYHGHISYESVIGEGTSVRVKFPLVPPKHTLYNCVTNNNELTPLELKTNIRNNGQKKKNQQKQKLKTA